MKGEIKDHISKCDVSAVCAKAAQRNPHQPRHTQPPLGEGSYRSLRILAEELPRDSRHYFSNFFEIDRLYETTTKAVILKLKAHMVRYGRPDELVSDQGPQFRPHEFHNFAENYGFKHTLTSPYHHQSNGIAEFAVKLAKKVVRVAEATKRDPYFILRDCRNTPQKGLDTSPAQRVMNRRTKTTMPTSSKLLDPGIVSGVHEKIRRRQSLPQKYYNRGARDLDHLKDGNPVVMQPHALNDHMWRKPSLPVKLASGRMKLKLIAKLTFVTGDT